MSYPHPQDLRDPRQYPPPPRHAAEPAGDASPSGYSPEPVAPGDAQPGPVPHGYAGSRTQLLGTVPPVPFAAGAAGARPDTRYAVPAPRRESWPRFGDDLFRLAHDEAKLFVDQDLIALGLACAVLAELGVTEHIAVDQQDRLVVVDYRPPPDALAHTVLHQLASEPEPLHIQDWLRFLSADAYQEVARRMVLSGDLREITRKRLLGAPRVSYAPTDSNTAYWACARLNTDITKGRDLDPFDRVLVGLLLSTGVYRRVFNSAPSYVVTQLTTYSRLTHPPVPALLRSLDSLVGNTASSATAF